MIQPESASLAVEPDARPAESQGNALEREILDREIELEILAAVAGRVQEETEVERILDITLEELTQRLDLTTGWVFMGDQQEGRLQLAASRGVSAHYLEQIRTGGLDDCLCPEVFSTGHRMLARNTKHCPRMPTIVEGLSEPVAHACIPLHLDGYRRGVLNLAARPGQIFSDKRLHFLETVGSVVCGAIQRSHHERAERLRHQEARALVQMNRAIGGSLELGGVLAAVGRTAREILHVDRVQVLLGHDPRAMTVAYLDGLPHPELREGQSLDLVAEGATLQCAAIESRVTSAVADWATDPRVNKTLAQRWGAASGVVVPLVARDVVRGLLLITRTVPHAWSADEIERAEAFAGQAMIAIENAHLYEEARKAYEGERKRNREARALALVTRAIGGSLDVDTVLGAVAKAAGELLDADRVLFLLGSDPHEVRLRLVSGPLPEGLRDGQLIDLEKLGSRLAVLTMKERRTTVADEVTRDRPPDAGVAHRFGHASVVVAPLVAGSRLFGLLCVGQGREHAWSGEEIDVVDTLAAQAAVALDNARLLDEARAAYADLQSAQEQLVRNERMALVGTFASGLAHEVRNPLNSMGLQLAVLDRRLSRLDTTASAEPHRLTQVIRGEIQRLDALVGDFLLFSRTSRVHFRPAGLEPLIEDVLRLLEPEAAAAGVALSHSRVGGPVPEVRLDTEKMKQVLINLLRNAIEAQPEGGEAVLESGLADNRIRLAVRDRGPGLPEGLDLFQLFVTTKPQGSGLGLPIVQRIVLDHGGEIAARNAPGGGAIFAISLPLAPEGLDGAEADLR